MENLGAIVLATGPWALRRSESLKAWRGGGWGSWLQHHSDIIGSLVNSGQRRWRFCVVENPLRSQHSTRGLTDRLPIVSLQEELCRYGRR
jgi:hypothetical protein